jgi:hypothetical protein
MKTYTEILQELDSRKAELETVIMKSQGLIERLPEGKLRVSHCKGKPQYYKIVKPSDTCGKYINQKELKTAQLLAQKDYLKSVIRAANDEIALIDRSNHATDAAAMITAESVYDHLKTERKLLVSPALMSNEEFARAWEQERYTKSDYEPDEKIYTTKRGETVRSKSEMLIADLYYELGIPYRYECKFKLHGGKAVYPDFTILKKSARKLIYHEHMGKMDDEKYRKKSLRKLEDYRRNGVYVGNNLILTFEEEGVPFNIREFERSVREILF